MTVDLLGRLSPRKVLASWSDEHLLCPEHRGCRAVLHRSARLCRWALSSFAFCNGEVLFLLRAVDYTTQPESKTTVTEGSESQSSESKSATKKVVYIGSKVVARHWTQVKSPGKCLPVEPKIVNPQKKKKRKDES